MLSVILGVATVEVDESQVEAVVGYLDACAAGERPEWGLGFGECCRGFHAVPEPSVVGG